MKSIPPHIQELVDKVARHHVHRCPRCKVIWPCQEEQCKPAGGLLAATPCTNCAGAMSNQTGQGIRPASNQ